MVNFAVLACVLRTTIIKVNSFEEKSAPPEKILATPMLSCGGKYVSIS